MSSSKSANATASTTQEASLGIELSAHFDYTPASRIIAVRYTVHNRGKAAVAVFDRGDANGIAAGRYKLGEVGVPTMQVDGEDVTLEHIVKPLPQDIEITSPPTPVAIEVPAGKSVEGHFEYALQGTAVPKRLRWCVGLMRVGDAYMESPVQTKAGKLWSASFGVVDKQQHLCTRWYDVKSAAFQSQ